MKTKIAPPSLALVPEIVQLLEMGEAIVLPSDTTYALVAHAFNDKGLARIAQLKRWSSLQPLVLLTNREKAGEFGIVSPVCRRLMEQFPYPVTLAIPKKNSTLDAIAGGYKYILVACPSQFMFELIDKIPFPMVCSSASLSTHTKATTMEMALSLFEGQVPLIVDGGKSKYGTQSTIIDFTGNVPTIVNFGAVSYDDLRPILPEIELPSHLRK